MSMATGLEDFDRGDSETCNWRSSAKVTISAILWAKLAGLGALSALCVLNRRSRRCGEGSVVVEMALEAKAR